MLISEVGGSLQRDFGIFVVEAHAVTEFRSCFRRTVPHTFVGFRNHEKNYGFVQTVMTVNRLVT